MSVQNVWPGDLALIELRRDGRTDAPPEVLDQLRALGHVVGKGRGLALTDAGLIRARKLALAEKDLRQMAATEAAGRCALTTAGGNALHG